MQYGNGLLIVGKIVGPGMVVIVGEDVMVMAVGENARPGVVTVGENVAPDAVVTFGEDAGPGMGMAVEEPVV